MSRALLHPLLLTLASSAGLFAACTPGSEDSDASGNAIIGGSKSTSAQDAVVLIMGWKAGEPDYRCTGTLVAPNLVLTARHCVSERKRGPGYCFNGKPTEGDGWNVVSDHPAKDLAILVGQDAADRRTERAEANAWGKTLVVEGETMCNADLAFILLDRKLEGTIAPIRLNDGPKRGERITAVGWGLTEKGESATRRMQRSKIPITSVGAENYNGSAEFEVGESICSGDSGGPALSSNGAVIGVVSRGGGGDDAAAGEAAACKGARASNTYTAVSGMKELVERAFKLAKAKPLLERGDVGRAVGESCTSSADCASATCVANACRIGCATANARATCIQLEECVAKSTVEGKAATVCLDEGAEKPAPADAGSAPADAGAAADASTTEPADAGTTTDAGGSVDVDAGADATAPRATDPSSSGTGKEIPAADEEADDSPPRKRSEPPSETNDDAATPEASCSASSRGRRSADLGFVFAAVALVAATRRRKRAGRSTRSSP